MLAAAVVVGAAWLAGPPLAAGAVDAALSAAGLHTDTRKVTVAADPPVELLTGHADRIRVTATGVAFRDVRAARLDVTFSDVTLLDRTARTVDGRLTDAVVDGVDAIDGGSIRFAEIDLDGRMTKADVTLHLLKDEAAAAIQRAIAARVGNAVAQVTLQRPNTVTFASGATNASGHLAVTPAGALVITDTPLGTLTVLRASATPLELASVSVTDTELVLAGTVDASALAR